MWDFMDAARPNVFVDETKDGVERVRNSKVKTLSLDVVITTIVWSMYPCRMYSVRYTTYDVQVYTIQLY